MILRVLAIAALAALMGCNGAPGGLFASAPEAEAAAPTAAAPEADETQMPENAVESSEEAEPSSDTVQSVEDPEQEATPDPEVKPSDPNAAARARCVSGGGRFAKTGSGAFVCVNNTRDANKSCTASSQSEGACLARSGTCAPFTPLVGCNDIVTENGGMATVCID